MINNVTYLMCGKCKSNTDLYQAGDEILCRSCLQKYFIHCERCGEFVHPNDICNIYADCTWTISDCSSFSFNYSKTLCKKCAEIKYNLLPVRNGAFTVYVATEKKDDAAAAPHEQ